MDVAASERLNVEGARSGEPTGARGGFARRHGWGKLLAHSPTFGPRVRAALHAQESHRTMTTMLRSVASVCLVAALGACSPEPVTPPTPRDAGADVTPPTPEAGTPADAMTMPEAGPPPTDGGGGGEMCGSMFSPCNPVTNQGCPAGQACVLMNAAMRRSACVPAGRGAFGAACMSAEECQEGLVCLGNKCTRWCCGSGDNATCRSMPGGRPGAICNINVRDTGLFACSLPDNCDVHQQNCMNMTDSCVPVGADGTTQCITPNAMARPGGPCMFLNDCPRGHICVGPEGMTTCRPVCDPTGMAMGTFSRCAAPLTCGRVTGGPMNVGVCTMPMMM
jgi:hypothetical protein